MDAPPRRWVLQPLSPGLQLSDLRTISTGPAQTCSGLDHQAGSSEVASSQQGPGSPEALFLAQHVTVVQDGAEPGEEGPPSGPSSPSSTSSSRSGFYSFVEDPGSPEAELNQAWMLSPRRHAQLATLRMEGGFKLQTYASGRRPQSLFSEDGGEQQYQLGLEEDLAEEEEDEKLLRKEIIRHQAPRGAPRRMEGPGLASGGQQLGPVGPSTVDKDSINFTAARQQFLRLEQDRASALLEPVRPEKNRQQNTSQTQEPQQSGVAHVLDSGLDRPSSSSSSSSSSSVDAAWSSSSNAAEKRSSGGTPEYETPIEREIRLNQEREENLRLSRGLKISRAEMVEIKTRRLQSPSKAKDLQQDILKVQRNQQQLHQAPGDTDKAESGEDRVPSGDTTDSPSPCCPHRHAEAAEWDRFPDTPSLPEVQDTRSIHPGRVASPSDMPPPSMLTLETARSWRENLQPRRSAAPDFIEKEIQEALKREEELRELRTPREDPSPPACPPAQPAPRTAESQPQPSTHTGSARNVPSSPSHGPTKRPSSISFITAQPWTSSPSSPSALPTSTLAGVRAAPPAVRGLTDTLLQDFEERRAQKKLEENSYAGILRLDHINQELVESTRVTRHKNQRALLWEAGVFTNQADE